MALKDCLAKISGKGDEALSDAEVFEIADEVKRLATARKRTARKRGKALSDEAALREAAEQLAEDAEYFAKIEKRNRVINIIADQRLQEFTERAIADGFSPAEIIRSRNVILNKSSLGSALSAEARHGGIFADFAGAFYGDLERAGLVEFLARRLGIDGQGAGVMDEDIADALYHIGDDGKSSANVSKEARELAEIIARHSERWRIAENDAGGWIKKMRGYIVRQSWRQERVRRRTFEEFRAIVEPELDPVKTYNGADPEEFLSNIYDALRSGVHLSSSRGGGSELAFKGPGNLAKRISRQRILHFKDGRAWHRVHKEFGYGSLIEGVIVGMDHAARNIALMQVWGTNPRAKFDAYRTELAQRFRDQPGISDKIMSRALEYQFRDVSGESRRVHDLTLHNIGSGVRALQRYAKLGTAVVASTVDLAPAAAELRSQGVPLGRAYTDLLAGFLENRSTKEQREITTAIGVALDNYRGALANRYGADGNIPGLVSRMDRLYFKLNLLTPWTDRLKQSVGRTMAWELAKQRNKEYGSLPDLLRKSISRYGIDATRWNIIRQAGMRAVDGRAYLTADAVEALPDSAFAPLGADTPRKAAQIKRELGQQITAYYVDRADYAVPTGGGRERSIWTQGTNPGTPMGEAVRFVAQFKMFPTTYLTKVVGRELGGYSLREAMLQGKGDKVGLAHVIAMTTVLGMVALQAKQVLLGRSPRNPFGEDWKAVWAAAILQGGGFGIYGDFLFAEYSRYGRRLVDQLVGPAPADIARAVELVGSALRGEDVAGEAVQLGKTNMPLTNLFYTKWAMDYLIFYNLQELASPGYLRRMEDRVERENNQTFIIPPSSVID